MNQLQVIENAIQMTSLDLAELTGKRHDNVIRDIKKEIENLGNEIGALIFEETSYTDSQGKQQPCYTFGRKGAMQLALKYDAVTRFKVIEKIEELENSSKPKSNAEMLLIYAQQFVDQEKRLSKIETTVTTIQETFLHQDEDWRKTINNMVNTAAKNSGGNYQELRTKSYKLLEERGRCQLDTRLKNIKQRLEEAGATKTRIEKTTKMDAIEADPRLKEIYTTVVKELSIGALQV
ncbi:MAG: Rha family transcriptional regulator [Vulcanibacillus sp.]